MASFNGNIGTPSNGFNLYVEWGYSQSISGNYSDVWATGYVKRNNSSYYPYNSTSNASLTINGNTNTTHPSYNLSSDGYKQIITHSQRVYHNADGTKVINISFSFNGLLSNYYPNGSISQDVTLPTIPRASSVTATDCGLGGNTTITINRASSSFTHTLTYSFGSLSGTIATGVGTGYTWSTPSNFSAQIPNAKSGMCTITCTTYNGGTQIGTSTTTFKITVDEATYKPQVSGDVVDTKNSTIALTGDATKIIKGFSTALATYNAEAFADATISSVYINNVSVGASPVTISSNYTSFPITVVDSRGYRTTENLMASVIEYIPLTINATLYRTAPTTGEVSLTFSGNYFDDTFGAENNILTLVWQYREKGSQTWLTGDTLVVNTDYVINNNTYHSGTGQYESAISLGNIFNYQKAYEIKLTFSDKLISNSLVQTIPKGKPIFNWDDDDFNVNGNIKRNDSEFAKNSYNTSQDDTYSCDYINKINKKEFVVASITTAQTISSNYQVVLNTEAIKEGNFTISNGEIVIGEGIHHVRISGSIFVDNWPGGSNYLWGRIKKGNTSVAGGITGSTAGYLSAQIPTTIISVNQNDTIKLFADSGAGGSLRAGSDNTWICVEKVD